MHDLLKSRGSKPRKGTVEPCGQCGEDVYRRASEAGKLRFCTPACLHEWQRTSDPQTCPQCKGVFRVSQSVKRTFCSWECYQESVKVEKACAVCGAPLSVSARTYCSPECWATAQRTGTERPCKVCGKPVYVKPYQEGFKRFCSIACLTEHSRIDGAGSTLQRPDGYRSVYYPKHPNANKNGSVMEHRLVMEAMIGRPLAKGEQVHHINGIRNDNRPENLELIATGDHTRVTSQIAKKKRLSAADELEAYRARFGPLP